MARFFGRYEHSLDGKGRVILPAKFRGPFEHGGYLTQFQDGCLSLWTPDEFELQMAAMLDRSATGRSDRNLARLWASTSFEVEVDRQGRMPIPLHLRQFAGLEGTCWSTAPSIGWNCGIRPTGNRRSNRTRHD